MAQPGSQANLFAPKLPSRPPDCFTIGLFGHQVSMTRFLQPATHNGSHDADYFFKVTLRFNLRFCLQFGWWPGMTYAIFCQIKWSWTKKSTGTHQEPLLGAYKFGHFLRTVTQNSLREEGIWMQFQLETDLFANDCDHDSVMSESFFHFSNPCQFKPPSLLPWRENSRPVPEKIWKGGSLIFSQTTSCTISPRQH